MDETSNPMEPNPMDANPMESSAMAPVPVAPSQMERSRMESQKFCTNCGSPIDQNAEICPKCGVRQMERWQAAFTSTGHKNKMIAGLLAIFLGPLGVHKFYLNKPVQGIIYLVFTIIFLVTIILIPLIIISYIVSFIEGILYMCTNDAAFVAKYG